MPFFKFLWLDGHSFIGDIIVSGLILSNIRLTIGDNGVVEFSDTVDCSDAFDFSDAFEFSDAIDLSLLLT